MLPAEKEYHGVLISIFSRCPPYSLTMFVMYLEFRLIEWEFCTLILSHAQHARRFAHNFSHGLSKTRDTCGINWNSRNIVNSDI